MRAALIVIAVLCIGGNASAHTAEQCPELGGAGIKGFCAAYDQNEGQKILMDDASNLNRKVWTAFVIFTNRVDYTCRYCVIVTYVVSGILFVILFSIICYLSVYLFMESWPRFAGLLESSLRWYAITKMGGDKERADYEFHKTVVSTQKDQNQPSKPRNIKVIEEMKAAPFTPAEEDRFRQIAINLQKMDF